MQRQMSALVGNMARKDFFVFVFFFFSFFPGFVYIIILFTDTGVFFGNEVWLPGSHELSFIREQRGIPH